MNRTIRWAARASAVAVLATGGFSTLGAAAAESTTTVPTIVQEGTFWKAQERAVRTELPCSPATPPPPTPTAPCGDVTPTGPTNSPYVPDGTMVVQHSGGPTGADRGDVMWAAMEFDVFDVGAEGSVEKFTLTLYRAANVSNDYAIGGPPTFKACNIVAAWGGDGGTSPWVDRPLIDCSNAKVATTTRTGLETFTFDLTDFAQTWAEGKGFGVAFVPGKPDTPGPINSEENQQDVPPFKLSFATSQALTAAPPGQQPQPEPRFRPKVSMTYTPADDPLADLDAGFDEEIFDDGALDEFGDTSLETGGLDDFDDGSLDAGGDDTALGEPEAPVEDGPPPTALRTRPISNKPGFPWFLLLLLPLGLLGFWGSGTALGEAGDPLAPRTGGVSRVLAQRRSTASVSPPSSISTKD